MPESLAKTLTYNALVNPLARFGERTVVTFVLMMAKYVFFYHLNFGYWGLGNLHMEGGLAERYVHGESLIWNFWWIIPLLWNEWFFHKWPFYVHDGHHK